MGFALPDCILFQLSFSYTLVSSPFQGEYSNKLLNYFKYFSCICYSMSYLYILAEFSSIILANSYFKIQSFLRFPSPPFFINLAILN